jgi:3-oxoacyl-[acyl-carrier protein] reductase
MTRAMPKDFENKVALVTGASRGIGRAVAVRFAEGGAKVAIAYAGNDTAANEAKAECERAGAAAIHMLKFDVADPEACARAVEETVEKLGALHVLVNNAGISIDGLIMRYKADDLKRMLDVDLASVFHLCKAAVRPMMKQRQGSIVNLTSVVGEQGNAGQTVYSMAKAGLIGFTKSLARELGSRNIRVNAVSPGLIETDMTKELPEAAKKAMAEGASLGRAGTAREVAEAIAFLGSDRASFITGEVLRVNGGLYM